MAPQKALFWHLGQKYNSVDGYFFWYGFSIIWAIFMLKHLIPFVKLFSQIRKIFFFTILITQTKNGGQSLNSQPIPNFFSLLWLEWHSSQLEGSQEESENVTFFTPHTVHPYYYVISFLLWSSLQIWGFRWIKVEMNETRIEWISKYF